MEFVNQSSFWSFNHVFQLNGAEAALVFPCLNVHLLFLFNAGIRSKKACNQTCRILEMQLTPRRGIGQLRYLLLPALTLFKPVGFPAHQKALLLAHQVLLLQPHKDIVWQEQNSYLQPTCPTHRVCSVYQCHSE